MQLGMGPHFHEGVTDREPVPRKCAERPRRETALHPLHPTEVKGRSRARGSGAVGPRGSSLAAGARLYCCAVQTYFLGALINASKVNGEG